MAQLIKEAKRFQQLAGIITEVQSLNELNDAEQEVVDAILGEGINEGKFSPREILKKLLYAARKGILTIAIVASVLASCNFGPKTDNVIKDTLKKAEYGLVDSTELVKIRDENIVKYEDALSKLETKPSGGVGSAFGKGYDDELKAAEEEIVKAGGGITKSKYFPTDQQAKIVLEKVVEYVKYRVKGLENETLRQEIVDLTDEDYLTTIEEFSSIMANILDTNTPKEIGIPLPLRSPGDPIKSVKIYPRYRIRPFLSQISPQMWGKLGFNQTEFLKIYSPDDVSWAPSAIDAELQSSEPYNLY